MLSRLAHDLYWAGRYIERAESLARLINATTLMLLDLPRQTDFDWRPLIEIIGADDLFARRYPDAGEASVMRFLVGDRQHAGSIASSLASARENLRGARDLVPREVWEQVNALHLLLSEESAQVERRIARQRLTEQVVRGAREIAGHLESGMSRNSAYDMLCLGLTLERADMTTRIIDVRSSDLLVDEDSNLRAYQTVQWIGVLKSLSAFQMYRRHVRVRVSGAAVVRFLLVDTGFPRSVAFCLTLLGERLARLPEPEPCRGAVDQAMRVLVDVDASRLTGLRLSEFLDRMQIELNRINDAIADRYFIV